MPALNENSICKLATVTAINAKTVAVTTLYAVPEGKTFIPILVVVRVTSFTVGSKSVQAIASFGGNSATYDDFIDSQEFRVATNNFFQIGRPADIIERTIQAEGDVFKISIETGSDATTETWAVDIFGYLI